MSSASGVEGPRTSNIKNSKQTMRGTTTNNNNNASTTIGTKPTLIEVKPMRFLIMDAPRQGNLHHYIKEMRKHHVTDVVRVCEPTYHGGELQNAGIQLHECEYKDGTSPPKELIMTWLQLVEKTFYSSSSAATADSNCIAVHCVAGLGRAPVMVAIDGCSVGLGISRAPACTPRCAATPMCSAVLWRSSLSPHRALTA